MTFYLIPRSKYIMVYYEQLFINKVDNLEERTTFLETYNLSRVNQEEIENLNKPKTT